MEIYLTIQFKHGWTPAIRHPSTEALQTQSLTRSISTGEKNLYRDRLGNKSLH